jgi:cardiolipin synthase
MLQSRDAVGTERSPAVGLELLAGGEAAFDRILRRIDEARRSILIRCFAWRDDDTGTTVARHLLRAAERGVAITILKDRVGMHYEYLEGSKQSFFHKEIDLLTRLQTWFLMAVYGRWGSLAQIANPISDALIAHPNINVVHEKKRFDHAKVYVFDDEALILGGMGIGDDFRWTNVDFMVEISGREAVERFVERDLGRASFDPARRVDFLLHTFRAGEPDAASLIEPRLALIGSARERLTIAMAYLGDRRFTDALVGAVTRGVSVTLLTAARANILTDLNLVTCDDLLRRTGAPGHLRIVLSPRMVHGKAIVADGQRVDLGSANFTRLSHGAYEEVDLHCHDVRFAAEVEAAIERAIQDGRPAASRVSYRPLRMLIERAIANYQARSKVRTTRLRLIAGAAPHAAAVVERSFERSLQRSLQRSLRRSPPP